MMVVIPKPSYISDKDSLGYRDTYVQLYHLQASKE